MNNLSKVLFGTSRYFFFLRFPFPFTEKRFRLKSHARFEFLMSFFLLQPVRVRNWELQVQFKVTGSTKDLFGDGFAIWYTRDRMQGGEVFGSKDYFSGLAVIVDTYSNHNGPHNVSLFMIYKLVHDIIDLQNQMLNEIQIKKKFYMFF